MTLRRKIRWQAAALLALAVILVSVAPAQAQFGKNKIRYKDFEWSIYHSPHFDVFYYEEEAHLLQKVVSYAESAYDQLSQELDYKIEEPTPLIFYRTHSDFEQNNIILNFIPEGTGAFATPVRNRMVLPVDLPGPELMSLILHELTHIFQYHMLFGGNLGKGVAATPPLWFMEGMASYYAQDEGAREKMYLRDAVVNDRIPPITANVGGFFAYRFGHAVFEFIEERWGKESVRDFIIETRNTLGARVGRAVERTFGMDAEDFNGEFRRWLRRKYLPELVATGEPSDFGRPYRLRPGKQGAQTSPAAAPSGDLLAAFSTFEGQVDVVLFDNRNRRLLSNLTKGFDKDFQYLVAQELTLGRREGRDIAFSPDGNQVALFARKEGGRNLVLIDVLKGKIRKMIPMDVEQQLSPAWSPDGRTIAFSGNRNGQFDIFEIDLETEQVSHVTQDEIYDSAPTYSPDGQSMIISSVVGGYSKLFRLDRDQPGERYPLGAADTMAKSNETDAIYSSDGKRVYFTSDATGANNIFGLDLDTGKVQQYTNSVTGCFMPTVLPSPDGTEKLVYTAFWKGNFNLYQVDLNDPITEPTVVTEEAVAEVESQSVDDLARYEPSIEVSIDDSNKERYGGFNFFIENVAGTVGVSNDQTFVGLGVVSFSDFLGDRRIIATFQSIESFQNFDIVYADLSRRLQWQLHLYDDRDFFITIDRDTGFFDRGRTAVSRTGVEASLVYPINISHRVSAGLGYEFRELDFVSRVGIPLENLSDQDLIDIVEEFQLVLPPEVDTLEELRQLFEDAFGEVVPITVIEPRDDDFPQFSAQMVGDTTTFASFGPVTGRRWVVGGSWAPDLDDTGNSDTLTSRAYLEYRQYVPLSKRVNLAYRAWGTLADGNFATPIYFGGLDTVRGFDFRSLIGDRGFFTNLELRFPLIDFLATPVFSFQGVRGVIFLDVAGAWFNDFQSFRFYDSENDRLQDAVSSYGYGLSFRLLGLDWNFDFAKRWDFETTFDGSFESSFWVGRRF